ncbi:MAG: CopD family protein [Myxococcales bacterium]|nr:CopD family protein [Myxococcales bacterium]
MRLVYLASVWLHILAVTAWLGGMLFLILVIVPWMRAGNRQTGVSILHDVGVRFRTVGWVCFAIVVATGTFNLYVRGVRLQSLMDPAFRTSAFGASVCLKLAVFAAVVVLSAVHDFSVGPAATQAMQRAPDSPQALRLRRLASWMGRANALLALLLVALGVAIVRGVP